MKKTPIVVTLAVAFCFALGSLAQAGPPTPLTPYQAAKYLPNTAFAVSMPTWQITQDGTNQSVQWVDHAPNRRFAVYDPNGDNTEEPATWVDDVVLDKETGSVWLRGPEEQAAFADWAHQMLWASAMFHAGRCGWRLPSLQEVMSLFIIDEYGHMNLPPGHPFILHEPDPSPWPGDLYWTATNYWNPQSPGTAMMMEYREDSIEGYKWLLNSDGKEVHAPFVWAVRGGRGFDGY